MYRSTHRRSPFHPLVVGITLALAATAGSAADMTPQAAAQLLAQRHNLARDAISDASVVETQLLDGSLLTQLKGVKRDDGTSLTAAFRNGMPTDANLAKLAAGRSWRQQHGALTRAMVERLPQISSGTRVAVDLWYRADVPKEWPVMASADLPTAQQWAELAQARARERTDVVATDAKTPAQPLSAQEIPPLLWSSASTAPAAAPAEKTDVVAFALDAAQRQETQRRLQLAHQQDVALNQELRALLSPTRAALLARLAQAGISVRYASDLVPSIIVDVDTAQLAQLALWPELDAIDPMPTRIGEELGNARPSQNITPIADAGYTGTGVTVSVTEGGRVYTANPFLTVSQVQDASEIPSDHSTGVGGIIASRHGTHRGIAPDVTLISANGDYPDNVDWGSSNARILNHSFFADDESTQFASSGDRRLDYINRFYGDLTVKSAGNNGNGCSNQGFTTDFVTSPGKGYNTLSVGNYDDDNSLTWVGDNMSNCSSFGDPRGDGASSNHEKPEVSAVGTSITSTLISSDSATAIGGIGSGTSFAAPMVSGLSADLIEADPDLDGKPAALKSILMASALHNIEGSARLSDVDGAGGVTGTAAAAIVERGAWSHDVVTDASFPRTWYFIAKAGERVRFVINWQSNPNAAYTSDPLPGDVDLVVFRGDGTTVASSSSSTPNPFEIVDFIAPATELYQARASVVGSFTGTSRLGAAWWTGVNRFEDGSWFTRSTPPPLGDFFEVRPTEMVNTSYWRGIGIRPDNGDYDLRLYSDSWFGDPDGRTQLAVSAAGSTGIDFIVVDGNHWPASTRENYRMTRFGSGTGSVQMGASDPGVLFTASSNGLYGPYSLNAIRPLEVFDIQFEANSERRIRIIPAAGNANADLGMALFRSNAADSATWARSRSQAVVSADSSGPGGIETMDYSFDGTSSDYLGLAVYNKTYNDAVSFVIQVTPASIFTDGFESD